MVCPDVPLRKHGDVPAARALHAGERSPVPCRSLLLPSHCETRSETERKIRSPTIKYILRGKFECFKYENM